MFHSPSSFHLGRTRLFRILLIAFWFAASPLAAQEPGEAAATIWMAGAEGVVARQPEAGQTFELPGTAGARALALDPRRGSVWVVTDVTLSQFTTGGELLWDQKLIETTGGPVGLAVVPDDGSAWLARGERLESFGAGGQKLRALDLESPLRGMALDTVHSVLWVATAEGLNAHDLIGGYPVRSLEAGSGAGDPRAFSLDPGTGHVWLASADRLTRFDAEGARTLELPGEAAASAALLGDGHGGLWAVESGRLRLIGPEGEELLARAPFGDESEIAAWALDPGTRSLWLTDGRELVRLSASGWELDRRPLAGADGREAIFDMATASAADVEPPLVTVLTPASGSVSRTGRPSIEVRYRDDSSGVRAGSLRASVDGIPLAVECSYRAEGASCVPEQALAAGRMRLEVTVADEMDNVSVAAVAVFEVAADRDAADEDVASRDKGPGDSKIKIIPGGDPVYTPIVSPRGFRPNVPFMSASDVDHVDTASGNLVVTIPLGQVYTVGPTLEYQIRPVYNSNLWQHIEFGCPQTGCPPPLKPITFGSTNYAANAGLGWELHFGRLYGPNTPQSLPSGDRQRWPNQPRDLEDMNDRWMYVAPSGAVTYLHSMSGRNNGTASNPVRYSKDGKHTRMRQVSSSEIQVHMPNGQISVFETTSSMAGTEFCGGGTLQCWRFKELRDPYGNYMRVSYSLSGTSETWNVTDSTGRAHKIFLSHSHGNTAGGDGVAPDITQDGDEIGDLRKVVTKVELAAYGSQKATYDFIYTTRTLQRGNPHDPNNELPQHADEIRTRVLDRITVPENSQPWKFTTYTTSNPYLNGRLIELVGPSRGKIAWVYSSAEWFVPTRCTYTNVDPASVEWDYASVGVRQRISKKPNGTVEGTWTYESDLYPLRSQLPLYGPDCARANYRKTVVNAAKDANNKHTRTVYYNSVAQGPRFPSSSTSIDQWQVTDGGLPFSKDFKTGGSTSTRRFLSRQIFHCSGGSCGSAKRSVYLRYASEWRGAQCRKDLGDSAGCYQANPAMVAERTVFHDDGGKYIDVEHQQYNGAGNFRRTVTKDNFSGSTKTRTDTTNYTATGSTTLGLNGTTGYFSIGSPSSYLPSPTSRWILHPFSMKTAAENGHTYVTEFQFNGQGSMNCSRKWKSQSARGAKDLVVTLGFGTTAGVDKGLPVTETVAGGEWANLSTSLCSTSGSASAGSRYVLKHEYQYLWLKRTYINGYPNWYRATIDRNTGLPSVTYNAADQSTSHSYDKLGRLKSSTPHSSLGQAKTEIVYRNPSGSDPSVETSRKSTSGSLLTRETQVYDHFARPIRNIQRRPAGDASYTETDQKTLYNALGWVTKVTTRQNKASVNTNWSTRYDQYDAFGRPGRVISPDNWTEDRTYSGVRVETSKVSIRTSLSGNTSVTTTTVKDSRGRVTRVVNPLYETKATYDPYDVRISSQRLGGGINQTRLFGYDARGLLLNERHPEVGNSANGYVTYKPDAFGNRRRLTDHGRDLTYVYDNAGRLTQIKNTSGGKSWRNWVWANSNSGSNYQKGKITREIRHNYPGGGSDDWAVYEEYQYYGKLGQVSKKTTQLQFLQNPGDDRYGVFFSQTFAYDQLGNPTSYTYPKCETTPQNSRRQCDDGPNDVLAPNHTVTVTYNQGLTRRVSSSLGPWGQYEYHNNLQVSRLDYSNNVDGIFDQGTNGMARPRRLQYKKGSAQRFDTGTFGYDGAGNIWQIGADRYYYDRASRLLYGTVSQAGSGFREEYTYDDADNMTSYNRNGWGWQSQAVHTSSNRMRGGSNDIVYDGAGNMTSIGVGGLYVMQYDELNQQVQFDNNISGQQSIHLYAFGPGEKRLIAFDASNGERTFKFRDLQGRVLREYKVNGWGDYVSSSQQGAGWVFEKDYIHGPSGLIATRSRTGAKRFFHQDHLGSTRAITNESGTRVGFRHFYPFGVGASTSTGEDEPTVKFTGHERDPHNLTDYMLARTYLYPFGRFASVDPARDGWNLYTYVGNNPIGFFDPTGLAACPTGENCGTGPNGGARSVQDQKRIDRQRERRRLRREARSRQGTDNKVTGEGQRDLSQSGKGPSGERSSRQGGRNRERNVGIGKDKEHTKVAKGTGGRGARGSVGARVHVGLIVLDLIVGALEMNNAEQELGREMTFGEGLHFLATGERPMTFQETCEAGLCA